MTVSVPVERGRVVEFDDHAGLGTVETDDGRRFPFHCVQIADGSRTVSIGAAVHFTVVPRFGRYEAFSVEP